MMELKPEGYSNPPPQPLKIRHPARWCWWHFVMSLIVYGNIRVPRARTWAYGLNHWACYMRLRLPGRRPRSDHRHVDWFDIGGLKSMSLKQRTDPWTRNSWVEATYEMLQDHPELHLQ